MALVLIALIVGTIAAVTFLVGQSTTHGISTNIDRHAKARLIAETGLTTALEYVKQTESWRTEQAEGYWLAKQPYAGGSFRILFEDTDGDLTNNESDICTVWAIGEFQGVTHTVSARITPTVPPAANNLLLVVGDATSPHAQDILRVKQAQAWEYNVVLIDDGDSQAAFNEQFALNDVVWVSPTATYSSLREKLLNSPIGVVVANPKQWQSLKLSTAVPSHTTGVGVTVSDTAHYITEPFLNGPLDIFTESDDIVRITAPIKSGVRTLIRTSVGGHDALVVVDAGGALSDGSTAVGRRVWLPWGNSADMPFGNLNTDGLTILKRSLVWAASPPQGPPALAHWMLDETSGTVARDSRGEHHGDVLGGAVWSLGQVIGAVDFDGHDDYINILNHSDFQVTRALTITAWVRPESFGSGSNVNVVLRKGEGNPNNWQFAVKDGKATLFLDTYDDYGVMGNTTLPLNTWSHIAGTWDGSTVRIYLNGQPDNGNGVSHTATLGTDTRPLFIGGRSGAAGYDRFDGKIDDVRFYNYAVSAAELRVLYREGEASGKAPRLIAAYSFEEVKPAPALVGHWALNDAGTAGGGIAAADDFRVHKTARIDSYFGSKGPYDIATAGSNALASTNSTTSGDFALDTSASLYGNAYCGVGGNPSQVISGHLGTINGQRLALTKSVPIPDGVAPTGMPPSLGDQTIATAITLDSNRTYQNLTLNNNAVITVSGHRVIYCTRAFTANGNARIVIPDGSSLTIYTGRAFTATDTSLLNADTSRPAKLSIIGTSTSYDAVIQGNANVSAVLHTDRTLYVRGDAEFFGSATARDDIYIDDRARVHLDVSLPSIGIDDPPAVDEMATNMGQLRGGLTAQQPGAAAHTGNSIRLNGSTGHVDIPHHDDYLLDSGTIAFWFRADDAGKDQGLFSKDASGYGTGGHLNIRLTGGRVLARLSSTTANHDLNSGPILSARWYHVAMAFGPNGMTLHIDGTQVATNDYVGGMSKTSGGKGNYERIGLGINNESAPAGSLATYQPFAGRLDDVRIYSYALDTPQIVKLIAGNPLGNSTLAASTVPDTASFGAALDLAIPATSAVTWLPGAGLRIDKPQSIASRNPATKIAEAVGETNQFSVEIKYIPANITQSGPARIVTMSHSGSNRNFMVGQSGDRFTTRLRTVETGAAGSSAIDSDPVLNAEAVEHLIVSYDGTQLTFYRQGSVAKTAPLTGALTGWDAAAALTLASEAGGSQPWLGTLQRVAIYDRAFNDRQASNVFNGLAPGLGVATILKTNWIESP